MPIFILFYFNLAFFSSLSAQLVPFGFVKKHEPSVPDPCLPASSPSLGDVCSGGAIYAGVYGGNHYMITPSNCTDSATPTCNGTGNDTLTKVWRGSTGTNADITGIANITTSSTASTQLGDETTPLIAADTSVSGDSAADFCNDMVYAGHSDWYLPSKSELAYIYCKTTVTSHNTSNPPEDANCVGSGGKTTELTGFINGAYLTSTESSSSNSWSQNFANGGQINEAKSTATRYIRCVRRYN